MIIDPGVWASTGAIVIALMALVVSVFFGRGSARVGSPGPLMKAHVEGSLQDAEWKAQEDEETIVNLREELGRSHDENSRLRHRVAADANMLRDIDERRGAYEAALVGVRDALREILIDMPAEIIES